MTILVTGSAGHLGEALMRALRAQGRAAIGADIVASEFTDRVGSIVDPAFVEACMAGTDAVVHAATLHKPHIVTHSRQAFVDTNITGTLNLLEAAVRRGVSAFVYTSTTSVFGDALTPEDGAPAVWVTEALAPQAKNIYGATKAAAEDLCRVFHRNHRLPCLVLRTSRFFPEPDDDPALRAGYSDGNIKANEFLYRRVDIADVVDAHLLALERAPALGFGRYIISATTPFRRDDAEELRRAAAAVLARRVPGYEGEYARRGWQMFPGIGRVYDNALARDALGWRPRHDFASLLADLREDTDPRSPLAREVGVKGYHGEQWRDGLYPVD
jgi:UDP-glucose 4-epimerase